MIKQIFENEFAVYFDLLAEVECGSEFDHNNSDQIAWLQNKISVLFISNTIFYSFTLDDGSPVGFIAVFADKGPAGIGCMSKKVKCVISRFLKNIEEWVTGPSY